MSKRKSLKILITAGPTREYMDPVRFISNPSTGKIGFELATKALGRGHKVILISGPANFIPPRSKNLKYITIETTTELEKAVWEADLKKAYDEIIPRFIRKQIWELPQESMVLTTAYGIDREKIFYDCLENHISKRKSILENQENPNQMIKPYLLNDATII